MEIRRSILAAAFVLAAPGPAMALTEMTGIVAISTGVTFDVGLERSIKERGKRRKWRLPLRSARSLADGHLLTIIEWRRSRDPDSLAAWPKCARSWKASARRNESAARLC